MSEFDMDIQYVPGKENVVPDALSWLTWLLVLKRIVTYYHEFVLLRMQQLVNSGTM